MALLGFTTFYREGVEVVLFLQRYRLKLGDEPVFYGVLVGCALTAIVGAFTIIAHKKLPYKRMLVLTGTLLGVVLLIMVGEEAQEMQAAGWIPTTELNGLAGIIPPWMGLWFSVYPTLETIAAQVLTAFIVLGSYFGVHLRTKYRLRQRNGRKVRVQAS
jgi:high-affinity iron transporter